MGRRSQLAWIGIMGLAVVLAGTWLSPATVHAGRVETAIIQADADGLMRNVEDMMAHGGMGDARAIVHHCGVAARHAETIKRQLASSGTGLSDAQAALDDVIHQCRRVSERGVHADPGELLNPAIKARAAAREVLKALGLTWSRRS